MTSVDTAPYAQSVMRLDHFLCGDERYDMRLGRVNRRYGDPSRSLTNELELNIQQ